MRLPRHTIIVLVGLTIAALFAACAPVRTAPPATVPLAAASGTTRTTASAGQPATRQASVPPTSTLASTAPRPTSTAMGIDSLPRVRPLLDAINIRRGPGTGYAVVATLRRDETAAVLARDWLGNWFAVRGDAGLTGWVATNVTELIAGDASAIAVAATIPALPSSMTPIAPPTATPPSSGDSDPPRPTREPTVNPAPSPTAPPTAYLPPPTDSPPTANPYP